MRTFTKVLLGASALVLVAIVGPIVFFIAYLFWHNSIAPGLCSEGNRINTEAAALNFAQNHLRSNTSFWQPLGISEDKLNSILAGNCCYVFQMPGGVVEYDRWRVSIAGEGEDRQWFDYGVTFSTCGAGVELEKIVTQRKIRKGP